ncbi:MAG: hypothetical protein BJ554DRAFT_2659 [Olpidium bornovanus]|uniref:Uncharacterized protein n=1 Tax=Olpidium bornovanus TaxID=278681 RepID=A0A8H8A0V4_9FUNG|nr:MAG: hypothetical protein BJ554DRAFT_2659 [Olpidium bornovanus]
MLRESRAEAAPGYLPGPARKNIQKPGRPPPPPPPPAPFPPPPPPSPALHTRAHTRTRPGRRERGGKGKKELLGIKGEPRATVALRSTPFQTVKLPVQPLTFPCPKEEKPFVGTPLSPSIGLPLTPSVGAREEKPSVGGREEKTSVDDYPKKKKKKKKNATRWHNPKPPRREGTKRANHAAATPTPRAVDNCAMLELKELQRQRENRTNCHLRPTEPRCEEDAQVPLRTRVKSLPSPSRDSILTCASRVSQLSAKTQQIVDSVLLRHEQIQKTLNSRSPMPRTTSRGTLQNNGENSDQSLPTEVRDLEKNIEQFNELYMQLPPPKNELYWTMKFHEGLTGDRKGLVMMMEPDFNHLFKVQEAARRDLRIMGDTDRRPPQGAGVAGTSNKPLLCQTVTPTAMLMKSNWGNNAKITCYNCCPTNASVAFYAGKKDSKQENFRAVLDSGCTCQMLNQQEWFASMSPTSQAVWTAMKDNDQHVNAQGNVCNERIGSPRRRSFSASVFLSRPRVTRRVQASYFFPAARFRGEINRYSGPPPPLLPDASSSRSSPARPPPSSGGPSPRLEILPQRAHRRRRRAPPPPSPRATAAVAARHRRRRRAPTAAATAVILSVSPAQPRPSCHKGKPKQGQRVVSSTNEQVGICRWHDTDTRQDGESSNCSSRFLVSCACTPHRDSRMTFNPSDIVNTSKESALGFGFTTSDTPCPPPTLPGGFPSGLTPASMAALLGKWASMLPFPVTPPRGFFPGCLQSLPDELGNRLHIKPTIAGQAVGEEHVAARVPGGGLSQDTAHASYAADTYFPVSEHDEEVKVPETGIYSQYSVLRCFVPTTASAYNPCLYPPGPHPFFSEGVRHVAIDAHNNQHYGAPNDWPPRPSGPTVYPMTRCSLCKLHCSAPGVSTGIASAPPDEVLFAVLGELVLQDAVNSKLLLIEDAWWMS